MTLTGIRRCLLLLSAVAALLPWDAHAQNVANGLAAYNSYCLGCHGSPPSGGPDRAGNNPGMISTAINGKVPAMSFLRGVVSSQEIVDIAAYLGNLSNPVPVTPIPANDYSDLWFNPAESGWGLNLIQHPSDQVFGVMYTYDTNRKPMWLVLPGGAWSSPTLFSGKLYKVTGPPPTRTFDPRAVGVREVGTGTLTFRDRDNGTFVFSVDGVQVTKNISRQPF